MAGNAMCLLGPRVRLLYLPVSVTAFLSACGSAGSDDRALVRDSAGLTIAESVSPAWGSEGWKLAAEPSVTIGTFAGDSGQDLHEPRHALRLDNGTIVVGDQGRVQLRFYDRSGSHVRDAGRAGGGPGEFGRIASVFRWTGDSVAVFDDALQRITVVDNQGEGVRTISLPEYDRSFRPQIEGRRTDGSYLAYVPIRSSVDDLPDGLSRDSAMLVRLDPGGVLLDTLVTFANGVQNVAMRSLDGRRFRAAAPVVFSPRSSWTIHGGFIYLANSASYEIHVIAEAGGLIRIIRRFPEPLVPAETDRTYFLTQMETAFADRLSNERMALEVSFLLQAIRDSPLPETFPLFDPDLRDDRGRRIGKPLIVDALGNVWVLEYRRPSERQLQWSVFDPEGRYLGIVDVPEGFYVTDIGTDYVLGWSPDDLEVPRVMMYTLTR